MPVPVVKQERDSVTQFSYMNGRFPSENGYESEDSALTGSEDTNGSAFKRSDIMHWTVSGNSCGGGDSDSQCSSYGYSEGSSYSGSGGARSGSNGWRSEGKSSVGGDRFGSGVGKSGVEWKW